jgi:hypothetical protein
MRDIVLEELRHFIKKYFNKTGICSHIMTTRLLTRFWFLWIVMNAFRGLISCHLSYYGLRVHRRVTSASIQHHWRPTDWSDLGHSLRQTFMKHINKYSNTSHIYSYNTIALHSAISQDLLKVYYYYYFVRNSIVNIDLCPKYDRIPIKASTTECVAISQCKPKFKVQLYDDLLKVRFRFNINYSFRRKNFKNVFLNK